MAGNELREYLTERKAALNDGEEEWPHIFAALEWHAKQGKLDTWETEGTVFERGSRPRLIHWVNSSLKSNVPEK